MIASVDRYLYTVREDERMIAAHQFIANDARFFDDVRVKQESDFPREGVVRFTVDVPEGADPVIFKVRIPSWSPEYRLTVDGVDVTGEMPVHDGFVSVEVADRTVVELELDMSVKYMRANTAIRHDAGRLAVMRGPVVYCAESCDNRAPLWDYRIGDSAGEDIACAAGTGVLEGLQTVSVPALRTPDDASDAPLYMPADHGARQADHTRLEMIPYHAWRTAVLRKCRSGSRRCADLLISIFATVLGMRCNAGLLLYRRGAAASPPVPHAWAHAGVQHIADAFV